MTEKQLKGWLVNKLRRISYQWPPRKVVLKKARVSRGKYRCAHCVDEGTDTLYGPKEINVDHILCVVDPEIGFVDWNTYISRLFCSEDNWQILCKHHHQVKSFLENALRKDFKEEKSDV